MDYYHEAERSSLNPDSNHLWVKESRKFERSYRSPNAVPSSALKSSDVDVFLYGLTADEAERKIEHILAVLGNTVRSIIRSKTCVTFVREWPHRNVPVGNLASTFYFLSHYQHHLHDCFSILNDAAGHLTTVPLQGRGAHRFRH